MLDVAGVLVVVLADHREDLGLGLTMVFVKSNRFAIFREPEDQEANVVTVGCGLVFGLSTSGSVVGRPSFKLG